MKPLVSILIPAYNAGEWLAEAIHSALSQTWENKEIIVVDDGSSDRTLATAQMFASATVRVYTQRNQGAAATRNRAFQLSKGDYIQWLDADDLLGAEKLERQMDCIKQCGRRTLISGSWGSFLYRHHRAKFIPSLLWTDLPPAEWLIRKMANNLHMQTATWLVSRELTETAGPWNTRLLGDDDGEYFCRVLLASSGVKFVPEAKVYYRASGSSSLSYIGHSEKKREAQWISMELHIAYLRSLEDSSRVRAACVQYIQNWLPFFYPERLDIVQKAQQQARELGGQLETPTLPWKYSWLKTLFGWRFAKRAQLFLPNIRWTAARFLDKALSHVENRVHTALG